LAACTSAIQAVTTAGSAPASSAARCLASLRSASDELGGDAGRPDLLVAADYDPGLRYLCLTAFDAGPRTSD
jgi:hypothetical protein